jgi:hypothetical protein
MKRNFLVFFLTALIFIFTAGIVYINVMKQRAVDRSKLSEKVELSGSFQRWITNLKSRKLTIEGDEFRLKEENEIYNTMWMKVTSIDEPGKKEEFEQTLASVQNLKKVVFSPSKREFVDFRPEIRGQYAPNQVHFYGLKDDKIIDARILDCSKSANCYFDRAYFLDNSVFVISEVSRNIDKRDPNVSACGFDETCTYTFKIHVVDLINNSRLVYESKPFDTILSKLIPEL